jgi:hypothetical protein
MFHLPFRHGARGAGADGAVDQAAEAAKPEPQTGRQRT